MLSGLLSKIAAIIIATISASGYLGVTLLMAIESACIPLPSELIMPFAGYLVHTGRFNLWIVATAGAIGCNLGSIVAYEIGYYGGRPMVERFGRYILLNKHDLEVAEKFFLRYGAAAIFIGRLLPVVRTFIALPAGIGKMPRVRFHIYTFLGSWPWCLALAYIGMKLGDHWDTLGKYFHRFDIVIAVLLIAGIAFFLRSHWKNRMGAAA